MKVRHNKKRNTAFLFESLARELTKSIIQKEPSKTRKIKSLFKEYFSSGTALRRELECYKSLCETTGLSPHEAEKIIFLAKDSHSKINKKEVFEEQSSLIKQINAGLGKEVFANFIPNYKSYATVAQIFGDKINAKEKVLLESQIAETLTSAETKEELEHHDSLTIKSYNKLYNEKYEPLLPEQKELLSKYILSFRDDSTDFRVYLSEELTRLKELLEGSKKINEVANDVEMVCATESVLDKINNMNVSSLSEIDLKIIAKTQALVKEYED